MGCREFEKHGVGVLSQCYAKEKELTHELLTRELKPWGSTTLYSIADASQQMHFLGHSACQTKLNKIWMGRMALYTPMWKVLLYELLRLTFTCPFNSLLINDHSCICIFCFQILLCLFLPMLLPIIKFQPEEEAEEAGHDSVSAIDFHIITADIVSLLL